MTKVRNRRHRGFTRITSKNQVTLPVSTLGDAGLGPGDVLMAVADGPGRVLLISEEDALKRFAGALTGTYHEGYLDELRREWR